MTSAANLDYAQARLQARHGVRARPSDWSRIEGSRDLQHFLSVATTSPLSRWVRGLTPEMSAHDLERVLRLEWSQYVREIASWLPAAWQPAVVWAGTLTDLQFVARLADPAPCPAWMFADPLFGSVAPGPPAERAASLALTELAPLAPAVATSADVRAAWHTQWQRRLPGMDQDTAYHLQRLTRTVAARIAGSAASGPAAGSTAVGSTQRIERIFREAAGTAVSALAHLALTALDLERLRGCLAERAVFSRARQAA